MPPTKDEIEALKRSWTMDPCWDLETTDGFETAKTELIAYREKCEAAWEAKYQHELREYATKFGLDSNLKLAEHIRYLEERISALHAVIAGNGLR
jgi:hypothetical protein